MTGAALSLILVAVAVAGYAYGAYPALLWLLDRWGWGSVTVPEGDPPEWPSVSISLPAYNESEMIAGTLENLLSLEYPEEKLQILVISDASTDGTDEIVRSYADRGVDLIRLDERSGKTAAENAGVSYLKGEIVVNTDATSRPHAGSLKALVRAFQNPDIGVASGRDRSVGRGDDPLQGEARYVGYEMAVRELETRTGGIVGASGCYYAVRRGLHRELVPEELSRDFISALNARQHGYRAASIDDAVADVPRAGSLRQEYRRKVRTMARGLDSLWYARSMLNPFRDTSFAWKLGSHKLARWLVPLTVPGALAGAVSLASVGEPVGIALTAAAAALGGGGLLALAWPNSSTPPRPVALCGYLAIAVVAGLEAWIKAVSRDRSSVWEPTRRTAVVEAESTDRE